MKIELRVQLGEGAGFVGTIPSGYLTPYSASSVENNTNNNPYDYVASGDLFIADANVPGPMATESACYSSDAWTP